jgi:hypothetical protein
VNGAEGVSVMFLCGQLEGVAASHSMTGYAKRYHLEARIMTEYRSTPCAILSILDLIWDLDRQISVRISIHEFGPI